MKISAANVREASRLLNRLEGVEDGLLAITDPDLELLIRTSRDTQGVREVCGSTSVKAATMEAIRRELFAQKTEILNALRLLGVEP